MKQKTMDELVQDAKDHAAMEIRRRESGGVMNKSIAEIIGNGDVDHFRRQAERQLWKDQVVEAARKFVKCRGRYHSEMNTAALIKLFDEEPK